MYSRAEISQIKEEFWTTFGRYIAPQLSADHEKINWINYHTGIKGLYFRMEADTKSVSISIEIRSKDQDIRTAIYHRFLSLKKVLDDMVSNEWIWEVHSSDPFGKPYSRLYIVKQNVNVLDKSTWPDMITFLKPKITALDQFWSIVKDGFEEFK